MYTGICRLDATTERLSKAEKELKQVRQAHVDQQQCDLLEQGSRSGDQQTNHRVMELESRLVKCVLTILPRACYSQSMVSAQLGMLQLYVCNAYWELDCLSIITSTQFIDHHCVCSVGLLLKLNMSFNSPM